MSLSRSLALVVCAGLVVSGCVVVPVTTDSFDPDCRVVTHQMELRTVNLMQGPLVCNGCGAELLVAGIGLAAASAVVSGSVALVGNASYEVQHRMACMAPAPAV